MNIVEVTCWSDIKIEIVGLEERQDALPSPMPASAIANSDQPASEAVQLAIGPLGAAVVTAGMALAMV
jgi:hypothetical protein